MCPRLGLLLLALSWQLLAVPPVRAQPAPSPGQTDELVRTSVLPGRDPMELAQRFGRVGQESVPRVVSLTPLNASVGRVDRFWVADDEPRGFRETDAELRLVGESAYWYVERGLSVEQRGLQQAAQAFDRRIYPLVRRYFGSEWLPGVDGDPRITILLADLRGVGAYHSAADAFPRQVEPRSNEREMLYLNPRRLAPGSPAFAAALAHQLQHLIHWHANPDQETWLNEGSAELAASLAGYQPASLADFERRPDTQLTAWSKDPERSAAHYQAAFLFLRYLLERHLAPDDLPRLLATRARGAEAVDAFLAERGRGANFTEVFKDWAVANFLDEQHPSGGRFGYRSLDVRAQVTGAVPMGGEIYRGEVPQFGTHFLELVGDGDVELLFQGQAQVPLVAAGPSNGEHVWWSNRGDNLDAHLTRAFDLGGLAQARLRFRLWYETEPEFDYGYVLVSDDGGQSWQSLCPRSGRLDDPTGNNLGCGFSGNSGGGDEPLWTDEELDLTPFAGREVLVRFEYVTDQAYNTRGLLVDEVEVPELGFLDDAESEGGWESQGFLRSNNLISQSYSVRLLLFRGSQVEVVDLPLDETRSGSARIDGLGGQISRAVVAVSGLAPRTLEPASYTLELRAAPSGTRD